MYVASFVFALRFSMPTDLMLRLKLIEKRTRTAHKHRIEYEYKVCIYLSTCCMRVSAPLISQALAVRTVLS